MSRKDVEINQSQKASIGYCAGRGALGQFTWRTHDPGAQVLRTHSLIRGYMQGRGSGRDQH